MAGKEQRASPNGVKWDRSDSKFKEAMKLSERAAYSEQLLVDSILALPHLSLHTLEAKMLLDALEACSFNSSSEGTGWASIEYLRAKAEVEGTDAGRYDSPMEQLERLGRLGLILYVSANGKTKLRMTPRGAKVAGILHARRQQVRELSRNGNGHK